MAKNTHPRIEEIKERLIKGESMAEIGRDVGLSRQRIKQMAVRQKIDVMHQRKKRKAAEYFLKWGEKDASDLYAACREKFRRKKSNAIHAGHEWTIQFGHIEWVKECPILGLTLDYFAETTQENSPSFDRLDPNKGYVPGNVQIVSWRANRIKNDGTSEEHERIAQYIRERQECL